MKQSKLTYACVLCMSVLALSGLSTSVHAKEGFSRIIIFGYSLSDSGNVYLSSGETSKAPYELVPSYPYAIGGHLYRLNMADFIDGVVENPDDYGLTNVGSPCLIFWTNSDAKCENPEEYLFWDGIHPTAAGHNALADAAIAAISGN